MIILCAPRSNPTGKTVSTTYSTPSSFVLARLPDGQLTQALARDHYFQSGNVTILLLVLEQGARRGGQAKTNCKANCLVLVLTNVRS